jgi:signal transduction histidine kinase/CheY-like chemotaxis protein
MPPHKEVSVLVVDDRTRNIVALEAALEGLDCNLVKALSGAAALEYVLAQDFAVILLDVAMPGMDGFEAAKLIRSRERSRSTPIIFLTAYDRSGSRIQEGYRLGAIDYIYKPFDRYILRSKVSFFAELFRKTMALEQVTADLVLREQQYAALNADLEQRVLERTAAVQAANSELAAEADERVRTQGALRVLEQAARAEVDMAAERATLLAQVSLVLVEDFMDHRPMLVHVAHVAAEATHTACVIQLIPEDGDDAALVPLTVDHTDQAIRAELTRILNAPRTLVDLPWQDLDRVFLDDHPLVDSLSVPMLARSAKIGMLTLARFGSDARPFSENERTLSDDLAARVALAVENARLYRSARIAIELRDNFLSIAAHELKTPLTTIQGYSQLLSIQVDQSPGPDAVPIRRSAQLIEDRTKHLARLVEQILDVSRLDGSRLHLDREDIDLVGLVKTMLVAFEAHRASHEFRLHLAQERLEVAVDATRLMQVMGNLVDNAVRYSPTGSPIDVTIEHLNDHDGVVLSVRDRGPGIPEKNRSHIFDRFHEVPALAYGSGMGLGLHISREIVLLHGGDITVGFPACGGSEFTVRLPLTNHASVDTQAALKDFELLASADAE